MTTCPYCNRRTIEGKFCERCGRELPLVSSSAESRHETKTLCGATRLDDIADGASPRDAATCACPAEEPSSGHAFAPPSEPTGRKADTQTSCEDHDRWIDEKLAENDMKMKREAESRAEPPPPPRRGGIELCLDRICLLWENTPGSVRFHLKTSRERQLKDVELELSNPLQNKSIKVSVSSIDDRSGLSNDGRMMGNLMAQFPAMGAGSYAWTVSLRFTQGGMIKQYMSQFQLVVMGRGNAKSIAEQIVINIKNDIKASEAADVRVSNRIADELQGMLADKSENPFEAMRRYTNGTDRAWCYMSLSASHPELPPVPEEAKVDSISLDFGDRSLKLYAKRAVSFGRKSSSINKHVDIAFVAPTDYMDENGKMKSPYGRISRQHCTFEHEGQQIAIRDGVLDENRMWKNSLHGTFWNGGQVSEQVSLGVGEKGVLSLAGCHLWNGVSLDARAVSPAVACKDCPFADRKWCGNGRPSLVLKRRDGVRETYVCMWSCLHLGEIDSSHDGIILFRKDGAFAWGNESECGWLVPGEQVETAYGYVTISSDCQKVNKEEA